MNNFQIKALEQDEFTALFNLTDAALEKNNAVRMIVDKMPGFPCRVSLEDAAIGEEVILLCYQHHKTGSPYQSAGPVFIRKSLPTARPAVNEIPSMLQHRLLSLRGYDKNGMMKNAMVTEGTQLKEMLDQIFSNSAINYVHIHNAKPGCYNCVAERVV